MGFVVTLVMLKYLRHAFYVLGLIALSTVCNANEPPTAKPNPGPGAGEGTPPPKVEKEDPAHKRYSDQVNAMMKGDLLRAAYEKAHKPGAIAEGTEKQFGEMVEAFRAAIDIDPTSETATYCRLRLSGAYTYTGDADAGMRVLIEAVNVASKPADQIRACTEVALHCLQAMHKPAEALRWYRRAEALLEKIAEPEEKVKWTTAMREGIARCEKEMGK